MKILILANFDVGLYRFRKELIDTLGKDNEIYLSVPSGEHRKYFEDKGYTYIDTNVDRRGMNPLKDIKLFNVYRKLIKQIKPDLIITYTIKCNIYGGLAAKVKKVPYAVNITGLGSAFENGGLLKKLVTILYKISIKKAKVVFFENAENKDIFVKENIVKNDKCRVLNGAGVNTESYKVLEPTKNEETALLFVGRVMKEKGVEELFEVAKRCKNEGLNIRFDFIGDYEENYEELTKRLANLKVINYYGFQSDIVPFIQNVDAIILPSYHEGMSNALLEGAAMGRALLTSNIAGCKEAVIDGETGYTFNKQDSNDLYDKVVKFYNLTKQEKIDMGLKGRKHIEQNFDKKQVIEKTIEGLNL